MRYHPGEKPQARIRSIIDRIGSSEPDAAAMGELKIALAELQDHGEARQAAGALLEIALKSPAAMPVAGALKALELFWPLESGQEDALDKRMRELVAEGMARETPALAEAMASLIYLRAREQASAARPFLPTLLSFLEMDISTTGASAYYTLMILAREEPDYFKPYAGELIARLDSGSDATKTFAAKIIAALARERPEYVAGATMALRRMSADYPREIVKKAAAEACKALEERLGLTGTPRQEGQHAGSLMVLPTGPQPESGLQEPAEADQRKSWLRSLVALFGEKGNGRRPAKAAMPRVAWGRERDEMGRIMDDFSDIAPWIEAEFKAKDEPPGAVTERLPSERPLAMAASRMRVDPELLEASAEALGGVPPEDVSASPQAAAALTPEKSAIEIQALDGPQLNELRDVMERIKDEFSTSAGGILSAMGLEHLSRVSRPGEGDEGRQISARDFISAMGRMIKSQRGRKPVPAADARPAPPVDARPAPPADVRKDDTVSRLATSLKLPPPDPVTQDSIECSPPVEVTPAAAETPEAGPGTARHVKYVRSPGIRAKIIIPATKQPGSADPAELPAGGKASYRSRR